MLIDTHAHINFKAYEKDWNEVLERAFESGVGVINVGTQLDTSKVAVELAESLRVTTGELRVWAVVGLHPVHTYSQYVDEEESHFKTREEKFDFEAYKKLAENPLVVGIGECGLDYYRINNDELGIMNAEAVKDRQKEVFLKQIRLARELDKALVIHCRPSVGTEDGYEDILIVLDSEFKNLRMAGDELRFEIHSFTGSPKTVQEFLKRGAYVGLNGIISFDKSGNMKKVVEVVPLEKIVLETDSPYLTPVPHRGKRNEPSFVKYVAEKVAEIKDVSLEEVERITTENAKKLFKL